MRRSDTLAQARHFLSTLSSASQPSPSPSPSTSSESKGSDSTVQGPSSTVPLTTATTNNGMIPSEHVRLVKVRPFNIKDPTTLITLDWYGNDNGETCTISATAAPTTTAAAAVAADNDTKSAPSSFADTSTSSTLGDVLRLSDGDIIIYRDNRERHHQHIVKPAEVDPFTASRRVEKTLRIA
jgi:hypothetical protein